MTKLLPPKQQEALLQIPPSQEKTQGAEGTLCFHTHPHANSMSSVVICEPSSALCWPDVTASQWCGQYSGESLKWS
jgi:hypothetical protein